MANDKFIDKITKGSETYTIHAELAENANTATVAEMSDKIGPNVEKYSGVYDGKRREGLQLHNGTNEAVIELNDKGNLSLESKSKHVNIESKQSIQLKPTNKIIFDTGRRNEVEGENEGILEVNNDDTKDWASFKIKSRNIDLRCNDHGGIALQIAGKDKTDKENKIKFESNRINSILEEGEYSQDGEGGKGLEFGTFNNLHTSLYTKDYRFRGDADVYGVERTVIEPSSSGKMDYKTQSDDFKDPIDETTPKATWNEIIDAANKCKGKEAIASENYVNAQIAQAQLPEGEVDLSAYATTEYVDNAIASAGGGAALEAGNGITISEGRISVNNYSNIEPLTAITDNVDALKYIKIGDEKGNFQIDNKKAYTYQASIDTTDENFNPVSKDARIQISNIVDEGYYTDERKYYYSPTINTLDHGHNEIIAKAPVLKYIETVVNGEHVYTKNISDEDEAIFYQDESKIYYKANKKNAVMKDGSKVAKNWIVIADSDIAALNSESATSVSQSDINDYYSTSSDWDLAYIWKKGMKDEEGNKYWPSGKIWEVNEININLETKSKIKFDGEKIEVLKDDGFKNDVAMDSISVKADNIEIFASALTFSRSVTKNGVEAGYDPQITLTYKNNVADTEKVENLAAFIANYRNKHAGTTLSDSEIEEIYNRLVNETPFETVSVKLSELLGLVSKVEELEARIEALEGNSVAK